MMLRFEADTTLITAQAADGNEPARIAGVAVPWDTVATVSGGQQVKFERGAFDTGQKPAKLIENHDLTQLRGIVDTLTDSPDGLELRQRWPTRERAAMPWLCSRPAHMTP